MWPPLDYYAYAGCLFNFVITGLFTFYVISKKPELRLARLFCIFSAEVAIWCLFYFIFLKAPGRALAEFSLRTCMIPVAFIPASFFHFVTELIRKKVSPWVHRLNYVLGGVTALTIYTDLFAIGGAPQHLVFPYWLKPGPIFPLHVLHFVGVVSIAHVFLLKAIHESSGLRRTQLLLVFWGMLIAFVSGIMNYLTWYRTPIPPILMPLVSMLVFAMGYAIVRHQLLDIEIVIRRSLVYSLLIACITAVYLMMVLIMEHWFQGFFGYRSLMATLVVAFLIALGFNPLRSRIQTLVDRALFHGTPVELATQREQLLGEVRKGEQQKAVATLAAGLAHEIKNPLAAIKTFMEYLPEKQADPAFLAKFHRIVGQEVDKIQEIVHNLLTFAKPVPPKQETIVASELIQETLGLLSGDCMKRQVTVEASAHPECCLRGDRVQLKQVLLNLCLNSLEAMEASGGGRLKVSAARLDGHIILSVEDTGPGIAPKDLPHIYEPFFSTKERGTGLGLAVVESIIKEHRGRIEVASVAGKGTSVTISLPCY